MKTLTDVQKNILQLRYEAIQKEIKNINFFLKLPCFDENSKPDAELGLLKDLIKEEKRYKTYLDNEFLSYTFVEAKDSNTSEYLNARTELNDLISTTIKSFLQKKHEPVTPADKDKDINKDKNKDINKDINKDKDNNLESNIKIDSAILDQVNQFYNEFTKLNLQSLDHGFPVFPSTPILTEKENVTEEQKTKKIEMQAKLSELFMQPFLEDFNSQYFTEYNTIIKKLIDEADEQIKSKNQQRKQSSIQNTESLSATAVKMSLENEFNQFKKLLTIIDILNNNINKLSHQWLFVDMFILGDARDMIQKKYSGNFKKITEVFIMCKNLYYYYLDSYSAEFSKISSKSTYSSEKREQIEAEFIKLTERFFTGLQQIASQADATPAAITNAIQSIDAFKTLWTKNNIFPNNRVLNGSSSSEDSEYSLPYFDDLEPSEMDAMSLPDDDSSYTLSKLQQELSNLQIAFNLESTTEIIGMKAALIEKIKTLTSKKLTDNFAYFNTAINNLVVGIGYTVRAPLPNTTNSSNVLSDTEIAFMSQQKNKARLQDFFYTRYDSLIQKSDTQAQELHKCEVDSLIDSYNKFTDLLIKYNSILPKPKLNEKEVHNKVEFSALTKFLYRDLSQYLNKFYNLRKSLIYLHELCYIRNYQHANDVYAYYRREAYKVGFKFLKNLVNPTVKNNKLKDSEHLQGNPLLNIDNSGKAEAFTMSEEKEERLFDHAEKMQAPFVKYLETETALDFNNKSVEDKEVIRTFCFNLMLNLEIMRDSIENVKHILYKVLLNELQLNDLEVDSLSLAINTIVNKLSLVNPILADKLKALIEELDKKSNIKSKTFSSLLFYASRTGILNKESYIDRKRRTVDFHLPHFEDLEDLELRNVATVFTRTLSEDSTGIGCVLITSNIPMNTFLNSFQTVGNTRTISAPSSLLAGAETTPAIARCISTP